MWRKVLKICKQNTFKLTVFLFIFLLESFPFFAADSFRKDNSQSSISMPSSPSMPSLSTPSIGSGFYIPGSKDFYYGIQNSNKSNSTASAGTEEASAGSKTQNTGTSPASSLTAGSADTTGDTAGLLTGAVSQAGNSTSNLLTANDLSAMNGLGIFSSISNLLQGKSSGTDKLQNASFLVNQNSSDSQKLEQILTELSELKSQNAGADGTIKQAQNGFSNAAVKEPKILRFNVNGYDILSNCRKVYFSTQESDGTFLLTGDRKYLNENKTRSETFYFFFHADGNEEGITKYKVTPAVSQDYENTASLLYQLTQKNELEAARTGNLVTLHESKDGWNMDLLIAM